MLKYKNKSKSLNYLIIAFFISSLFLLSGCLMVNSLKGSVEGYVYEETVIDNRPLEGALVSINGASNTSLTDSAGYFRIDEVSVGSRTLTVAKEGYMTYKLLNTVIIKDEIMPVNDGEPIIMQAVDDKYLFDGGVIYYDSEDYPSALIVFEQLINDYPDSEYADNAQYYIAYIYEKQLGQYVKALLEYYNFLMDFPDSELADDSQLGIGNCSYAMGQYYSAIEGYQKVINNYPESTLNALAQYSLAQSYRKLLNYGQAIIEFFEVIANYPDSEYVAAAQYYAGYSYYQDEEYNQAILEFQDAVDNYPQSNWPGESERLVAPCAQYYIGWCHGQKLGQWNEAVTAYQLVIDNYPESTWNSGQEIPPDAQYQIGWAFEQLELWNEAVTAYQLVIDNYPESTWSTGGLISDDAQERIDWINDNHPPGE